MNFQFALLAALFFILTFQSSFSQASADFLDLEWEGEQGNLSFVAPYAEKESWSSLIQKFGGRVVNTESYQRSAGGFDTFMKESGVTDYDPIQIITPPSAGIAKKCGVNYLLPSQSEWARGAAIALWAQKISAVAGEKPIIANWYRSACYNKSVGGVIKSDHLFARSADLDFKSQAARRKAQAWLCSFWNSKMNMQIGLGGLLIHLGAESDKGKRNWYYATYRDSDKGKTCFDR